jgi:cytoskeletal protein CcmA (bactofilin family)
MFGRRNPDSPSDVPPTTSPTPEADIDLDLLPDLPPMLPPRRREPEVEPPVDPAWHASATPAPALPPRERPVRSTAVPAPREKSTPAPDAPTIAAPAEGVMLTTSSPVNAPTPMPSITLPRPATPIAGEKPAPARLRPTSESIIGPDDFFDGRYRSERGVRIQGNARGSIESRQYIFVEGSAQVEADLSAEDITVAGSFNGKIECRRKLEITSTGKVHGQITTALLVVHEGGLIDGELHMQETENQAKV